jgi:hypothetical protein
MHVKKVAPLVRQLLFLQMQPRAREGELHLKDTVCPGFCSPLTQVVRYPGLELRDFGLYLRI